MHEASLCDALFDQVDVSIQHADPGAVVREIHVAVGELAGVDPELFQIAFDTLREDRHPHATLITTVIPARWHCPTCTLDTAADGPLTCPVCQTPLMLATGGELTLQRIELELPPLIEATHV